MTTFLRWPSCVPKRSAHGGSSRGFMTTVPSLAETQQLLWKLITAPEGAAAELAHLGAAERAVAESLVRPCGRLRPVERLEIYADMYFYRLRDALREDFVAVHSE